MRARAGSCRLVRAHADACGLPPTSGDLGGIGADRRWGDRMSRESPSHRCHSTRRFPSPLFEGFRVHGFAIDEWAPRTPSGQYRGAAGEYRVVTGERGACGWLWLWWRWRWRWLWLWRWWVGVESPHAPDSPRGATTLAPSTLPLDHRLLHLRHPLHSTSLPADPVHSTPPDPRRAGDRREPVTSNEQRAARNGQGAGAGGGRPVAQEWITCFGSCLLWRGC
jgi:hypothetical protein